MMLYRRRYLCPLVLIMVLLFSFTCNANEVIVSDNVADEEGRNVEPRTDFWTVIPTTSGNIIVPVGTKVPGASSYYVRLLQCSLNTLGFNCGTADGIYGTNTRNAIISFQSSEGLSTDGIVGVNTWQLISYKIESSHLKVSF